MVCFAGRMDYIKGVSMSCMGKHAKATPFQRTSRRRNIVMKKFVCPVCGYVHEGNEPPEFCPQCKCPGARFTVQEEIGLIEKVFFVVVVLKELNILSTLFKI